MWDAWISFNGSHRLGAITISIFYILLTTTHMEVIRETKSFILLAALIGASYLYPAIKY